MSKHLYCRDDGAPLMRPSFVCYADILGYTALSTAAIASGTENEFLTALRSALSIAYKRLREHARAFRKETFFSMKCFTDNIVVGYPIDRKLYGEPELIHVVEIFAELQATLTSRGYFLRGGIAYGDHYMDDDIVFGPAFMEAVDLDQKGAAPRLLFARSALEVIQYHLGFWSETSQSPHYEDLLADADNRVFLNYLGEAFLAFPDAGANLKLLDSHRAAIEAGLQKHHGEPGIRKKFEWAAHYHNFICREFPARHPVPQNPDADEVYAAACVEVQQVADFQIDIEETAAGPKRIQLEATYQS